MKRWATLLSITCVGLLAGTQLAFAQSPAPPGVGCQATSTGVFTTITATDAPVPSTEFDVSLVSSVRGEVFHITLPAGFDVNGASVSVGPAPLGRLTIIFFQDLDQDDVQDPGEPIISSTSLISPCHPGPTRAQECSNEGWRSFGLFESQGDCVAYVRTRGGNEPGQNEPGPPGRGPEQTVTGSGISSFCDGVFEVNAQSGPTGEDPTGQVTCGSFFGGPVTCLNVNGNVALLTIETSTFGTVALRITDFGTTGDQVQATTGSGCALPQAGYFELGFSGGDITITG